MESHTVENAAIERFVIEIADSDLDDLVRQLKSTRWAPDPENEDQTYGLRTEYLKSLVDYWIDGFDWRAAERRINEFTHHRVQVDSVPVRFIREPGKGPAPIPLILSHGWPWTFWDYSKVIRPLADPAAYGGDPADAFEVIVPSLAGFGFSTPTAGDMNHGKMPDRWNTLMTDVLGHEKYAAGVQITAPGDHPARPQVRIKPARHPSRRGPRSRHVRQRDLLELGRGPRRPAGRHEARGHLVLRDLLVANKGLVPGGHAIVGASQGGTGALTLAEFHPDRFRYGPSCQKPWTKRNVDTPP
jgi:pimeloyl-ACP methyl ester carboxylesterase